MSNVTIIMCTWKRIHQLPQTIGMLESQTNQNFTVHIWNNNYSDKDQIDKIVSSSNIPIEVTHWEDNVGGIGRFYAARKVTTPYVIFVDDDQIFDESFVETLLNEANPNTISGWWAWNMLEDYHHRTSTQIGNIADYIGTGGMIVPSSVFQDNRLFEDLPREFLFVEDLWLSRFFVTQIGGTLIKSSVNLKFMKGEDDVNQHHNLTYTKSEFYSWLKENGYL